MTTNMLAFLLGVTTAICKSGKNIGVKFATRHAPDGFIGWGQRLTTAIWLLPVLLITPLTVPTSLNFLGALAAATLILGTGAILTSRALRLSDISLVTPILSFTPLIVIIPAYLLLGERPTPIALAGILAIVLGTYLLNITHVDQGYLEPIRALTSDKGVQTAALVTILSALLPPIDKIGIQATNPFLWPLLTHALIVIVFLPVVLRRATRTHPTLRLSLPFLVGIGFANAVLWIAQAHAYTLTNVAYITALKRLALPLNLFAGYVFFEERVALSRLPAVILIVLGVILLAVGGL